MTDIAKARELLAATLGMSVEVLDHENARGYRVRVPEVLNAICAAMPKSELLSDGDLLHAMCKAYADATGYYVAYHRGLSSVSADTMRKGMSAAIEIARAALARPEAVEDGLVGELRGLLARLETIRDERNFPAHMLDAHEQMEEIAERLLSRIAKAPVEDGVTQADRDAAADAGCTFAPPLGSVLLRAIRRGERDDHPFVQSFHRHRLGLTSPDRGE